MALTDLGRLGPPPVPPARDGHPAGTIALGAVTRAHLARVLQQHEPGLLLALLETAGGDPAGRWRLVLDAARFEPEA